MSGLNSDLVRDSKLEARFIGGATHHALLVSDPALGRRRRHEDERWFRKKRLGGGSYGTVWLESCTDGRKKGALRAVKEILKPSPSDSSKDFLDYGRELEAIAKFSNDKYADYFVKSYGWFDSDHAVYIAMEYIENGDLQKYLVDPFPEFEAQVIVSQLADGLEFMHNNAYTHRDLKPANILVLHHRPNWWLKIGDFGITKRVETETTALRTHIGTQGYMAPEIQGFITPEDASISDSDEVTYSSAVDIWSLGEIAFRLVTNEPAFLNNRLLFNYVTVRNSSPSDRLIEKRLSVECRQFIQEAMAASPSKRPTATQVRSCPWISPISTELPEPNIPLSDGTLPAITNATDEFKLEEASAVWSTAELTKLSLEDQLGKGTSTELTQVPTLIQPRKKPFAEIAQAPFPIEPRKKSSTELTQGHILLQPKNKAPIAPKPLSMPSQVSGTGDKVLTPAIWRSGLDYDFMIKMLLVGDSTVGKSDLILRFGNDDTFKPSFITTIGLDFKIRTTEVDGKRVKLQLWDTAGHERYHTITSAYYRGATGIFLVYDVTNEESFNSIRIWNEEVDRNTGDRHIKKMLIGNNSDLVESRAISHERGQALADELDIPFLEVSSKLHVNVENALFSLTRAIIKNQQSVQNNVQNNPGPKSNEQGRWKGLKWPWT